MNIWENRVSLSCQVAWGLLLESERETARESNEHICVHLLWNASLSTETCFWVLAFLGTVSDWCCLFFSLCATLYPHPATTPTAARLLQGGRKLHNGNKNAHTTTFKRTMHESHINMSNLNFTSNEKQLKRYYVKHFRRIKMTILSSFSCLNVFPNLYDFPPSGEHDTKEDILGELFL